MSTYTLPAISIGLVKFQRIGAHSLFAVATPGQRVLLEESGE